MGCSCIINKKNVDDIQTFALRIYFVILKVHDYMGLY